jgi:hypothetical protein
MFADCRKESAGTVGKTFVIDWTSQSFALAYRALAKLGANRNKPPPIFSRTTETE